MAVDDFLHSSQHPLLHTNGAHAHNTNNNNKNIIFVSLAKWVLRVTMWVIFLAWVIFLFLFPTDFGTGLYDDWVDATSGTLFGETGTCFLIQTHLSYSSFFASKQFCLKSVQEVRCSYTAAQLSLLLFLLFHIFSSLGKTNYK